jgi:murein tripeptide amidase MpaA
MHTPALAAVGAFALLIAPPAVARNQAPTPQGQQPDPQQAPQPASIAAGSAADEATPALPAVRAVPHAELLQRARQLGGVAALVPVGTSRGGREIFALRLAGDASKANEQPALLVVANVDGSQAWTSSLALHHAEQWVQRAAEPEIAALLASTTIYVVPCANPDAHERRFATPRHEREATGVGVDNDRDGRSGEDPASDVDGDGRITLLRVADPRGEWIADPLDARALVKADKAKGETGMWRVWPEGRDLDGDERVAEDEVLDACVNRNFPAEYKEHTPEAGAFPTDEPETRALCEFVIQRPQIALVVTYGSYENLVDKPKAVAADAVQKRVPTPGVVEADAALLAEFGKRYAELTGAKHKGRGGDAGTWQTWAYAHRGLWSLAINAWDIPLDAPEKKIDAKTDEAQADSKPDAGAKLDKPEKDDKDKKEKREPSEDAKRLRWIDANDGEAWRFVDWRAFEHPELGACEIGGFAPFARTEPPAASSGELARKQFEFVRTLGADLARLEISELTAKPLGGELFEVRAAVTNPSRLPFMSASATRTDTVRPARLDLELAGDAELIAGDRVKLLRSLDGSGGRYEARWLVRAKRADAIALKLSTQHAGRDARVAEVAQ